VWCGQCKEPCSAPRTSPKSGSERFVVREESAASRAGQPAFSIACTVSNPARQARFLRASMGRVDRVLHLFALLRLDVFFH
jgi:hypothetical protein